MRLPQSSLEEARSSFIQRFVCLVQSVPGGAEIRARLAVAYIRALWLWACPLVASPPVSTCRA
eukprot:1255527-Pyramimonas_sp.AAC.1